MKISVIVPIYNILDCLERCVCSLQAQTYENLNIILVDDGSTDGTGELVDKLAATDPKGRTLAFHKENGGSSSARNYGIERADGEYLGFVDSDDFVEPDMYEKLAEMVARTGVKVAQISRDEISEDGSRRPDVCTPPTKEVIVGSEEFMKELLLHKGDCSFCTKLVSKKLFEDNRFPEGELNEDFRLFVTMLSAVDRVGILPDYGYHVYYREGSNTRRKDKNDFSRVFTDIVVNADRVSSIVEEKYPKLVEYANRFALVQRLDYMLHIPIPMMTNSNDFYRNVKKYLRKHRVEIKMNMYLTEDQRNKLRLLSLAPKTVRTVHKMSMIIRHK